MATLKFSRQRNAIKENLKNRTDHPSADMVYQDIRKIYPNVSLGTVYRNLALLTEIGEIVKLPPVKGVDRYDGNTTPHNHFVCRICGAVLDMPQVDLSEIEAEVSEGFEGEIENCSISLYGVCPDCLKKEKRREA